MKRNQGRKQLGLIDNDYEDDARSDNEDSFRSSQIPASSDEDDGGGDLQTTQPDEPAAIDDEAVDLYTPVPSRGPTVGKKQTRESIKQSGKIKVEYNRLGMMVGKHANDISSLSGVLARTSVPITYDDWRLVPKEIKERVWDIVNVSSYIFYIRIIVSYCFVISDFVFFSLMQLQYELHPRSKGQIMSMVGSSFRNFKYYLKKDYILPNVKNKKLLYLPPHKYPSITKEDWRKFVDARISTESKVMLNILHSNISY